MHHLTVRKAWECTYKGPKSPRVPGSIFTEGTFYWNCFALHCVSNTKMTTQLTLSIYGKTRLWQTVMIIVLGNCLGKFNFVILLLTLLRTRASEIWFPVLYDYYTIVPVEVSNLGNEFVSWETLLRVPAMEWGAILGVNKPLARDIWKWK